MNTVQVEQALGMFRTYLVECAAEQDWSEHRWSELADSVRECFRRAANAPIYAPAPPEQRLTRDMLRRVVRFVNDYIDTKLTWDDIADGIGMDRYAFGRRFKLTTGITPHQYVIRCRIRKAMKLLADGRSSLADIALEVGCSCQSHFTTLFRDHVGTTPGKFRRRAAPAFEYAR
jgi:transcriptional regulator GlxA family with amidase domain